MQDIEDLKHQLNNVIDQWAAKQPTISFSRSPSASAGEPTATPEATVEPAKPKDKRLVRTKSSGDRVYLLDETKKTRQWISKPELIDELGFTMADVGEADDSELIKYQLGPVLYKVD